MSEEDKGDFQKPQKNFGLCIIDTFWLLATVVTSILTLVIITDNCFLWFYKRGGRKRKERKLCNIVRSLRLLKRKYQISVSPSSHEIWFQNQIFQTYEEGCPVILHLNHFSLRHCDVRFY